MDYGSSSNGEKRERKIKINTNGGGEEEDRLSSLPDFLLVDILSLLPVDSAAATSTLSRRWRHLWTLIPRLVFSWDDFSRQRSSDYQARADDFFTTVDYVLRQFTSPKILSFEVDFLPSPKIHQLPFVDSWIREICGRNVEEIKVTNDCFYYGYGPSILLPSCIFECQSLVSLYLDKWFDLKLPGNGIISLPNLKKLKMHIRDSHRDLMSILFKSCPLLEDLCLVAVLDEDEHFVDISSHCLRRLAITASGSSKCSRFVIDAINLKHISISGSSYSVYSFVKDPIALLEADIEIDNNDVKGKNMLELLHGISSARSLHLYGTIVNFINYVDDGSLPTYLNATNLSTNLNDFSGWSDLFLLLQCFPNLEVLVLSMVDEGAREHFMAEGVNWVAPDSAPVCFLSTLSRIEMKNLTGSKNDWKFLEYVLSKAKVLEQLLVSVCNFDSGSLSKEFKLYKELYAYPKSSLACEIEFSGDYLNASSKGYKFWFT